MEHYRRLGFAEKVRAQGLPPDYPTDIAYFTRYTKHELARFSLPSARAAREMVKTLTGSWSAAELPHRVLADVRRGRAAGRGRRACPTVSIRPGWRMTAVRDTGTGVEVDAEASTAASARRCAPPTRSAPTAARSPTRKTLGYRLRRRKRRGARFHRRTDVRHPFPQRRGSTTSIPHPRAWMYWTVNRDRRAFMASGQRPRRVQLPHPAQARRSRTSGSPTRRPRRCSRRRSPPRSTSRSSRARPGTPATRWWRRNSSAAASSSAATPCICSRRPAGSATTPPSRMRSISAGSSPPCSRAGAARRCSTATRSSGRRSPSATPTYARGFADSLGLFVPPPELEDDSPAGEAARKLTGDHFNHHARFEFNIPGITFGGRYDGSPIVVADGTAPPPDAANTYAADRLPRRPRAASLARRRPLALRHARLRVHAAAARRKARRRRAVPRSGRVARHAAVRSSPVAADEARDLYGADLALIRPDQIVAWRGNSSAEADAHALSRATGQHLNSGMIAPIERFKKRGPAAPAPSAWPAAWSSTPQSTASRSFRPRGFLPERRRESAAANRC